MVLIESSRLTEVICERCEAINIEENMIKRGNVYFCDEECMELYDINKRKRDKY